MTDDLLGYLEVRKAILEAGGSNDNSEDLKDALVELTCDFAHFTDMQIDVAAVRYRDWERAHPEYVARGDALVKVN